MTKFAFDPDGTDRCGEHSIYGQLYTGACRDSRKSKKMRMHKTLYMLQYSTLCIDEIARQADIPFINLVESCVTKVREIGVTSWFDGFRRLLERELLCT